MAIDALTISALIISVLVVLVALYLTVRARRDTEAKLRRVADQSALEHESPSARELCSALRELYPNTCPGLDYEVGDDGHGAYLRAWYAEHPRPSRKELEAVVARHRGQG